MSLYAAPLASHRELPVLFNRSRAARAFDDAHWRNVLRDSALIGSLTDSARESVRALAQRFLGTRRIVGASGFEPSPELTARIACEACTLLIGLDACGGDTLAPYAGVREVIVYPEAFFVDQVWTDEHGVEHERRAELAGEAWDGGPVILSRSDVESSEPGFNVVLHEFAHVLDAGNGRLNGFPAIADPALRTRWPMVFQTAWSALERADHRGRPAPLDPYALEDPAEFFAVATETFFTDPESLAEVWPDLYASLSQYYGQSPRARA